MKNKTADFVVWLAICIWAAVVIVAIVFVCSIVTAQSWDWSPPAPHHAAVCKVTSGNRSGSGIYVQYGKLRGVLTVAHISTGGRATVQFSDSTKATGKTLDDKFGHDIAFIFVSHPSITPVSIAKQNPLHLDRVEFVTKGGPEHRIRSFWGNKRDAGPDKTKYDCDVLSGDSGGGIFNTQGELVGIQAFGQGHKIAGQTAWNAYHGAGGASCERIRDFLKRISQLGKCGPRGCPAPSNPRQQFYPPAPFQKPDRRRPAHPATPKRDVKPALPSTPPGLSIDYRKLVEMILLEIDLEDFRGPVGSTGPAGRPGAPGINGRNGSQGPQGAAEDIDLDDLVKRINKRIKGSIRVKVRPIQSE